MRISDWSSDVCSSDLGKPGPCAQVDGMKIGAAGNGGNPLLPERSALSPSPWHCFLRPKNDVQTIGYGNRRCRSFSILPRSEEHTSELQSLMRISYAVFCFKKKKKNNTTT